MLHLPPHLARPFLTNYPEFPDSRLLIMISKKCIPQTLHLNSAINWFGLTCPCQPRF